MPSKRPPDEGRLIQLVYYLYVGGSAFARALPERWVYGFAHVVGTVWAKLARKKRIVVERNLARVTGLSPGSTQLEKIVDDAFRSYARYWLETFRLVREDRDFFLERFVGEGNENIERVRRRGRGAIVVVGHLGNWDAAGAWVAATGRSLVTVAEVLRPRRMFEFFADHRARLGMTIFPAEKGVTARLMEELSRGAVVAILGDRDLKGTGPVVDFFGEPTTIPGGSASLALKTDVPLMVAGVYSVERADGTRGWVAEIGEPIDPEPFKGPDGVAKLTQVIAHRLETAIARRPEEWHVFQPFWQADRRA